MGDSDDNDSNGYESNRDDYYEEDAFTLNEMYDFEREFDLEEKENGKYYLGMYMNMEDVRFMSSGFIIGESPLLFFGNAISTKLFFKYPYQDVLMYLRSIIMCKYNVGPIVDIMKLSISEDGLYLAIIKTHWISLIQRHWRKILENRKKYFELHRNPKYLMEREFGKHNNKNIYIKNNRRLRGMLSMYKEY
jgi:hypothetical protein